MQKLILAFACIFGLSACGTRTAATVETYSAPRIGSTATMSVGDYMIKQMHGILADASIDIAQEVVIDEYKVPPGNYLSQGENSYGSWFGDGNKVYFFQRKADGLLCTDKTKLCTKGSYIINRELSNIQQNSFQQTIIYNGKIGNKINLGYREFSNNLARPAFSNSVEYDLSDSKIVGYKGARFEIINASNTEITFKVLSGFSN